MKINIRMNNLTELKKKVLEADMAYTQLILVDELDDSIKRLKGDRNAMFKIVNLLSKISYFSNLTIEMMILNLESMKLFNLMEYSVKYDGDITILDIDVNDEYFEIFDKVPMIGKFISMVSGGRNKFVKEIEKTVLDNYTKDYQLKVVAEDACEIVEESHVD